MNSLAAKASTSFWLISKNSEQQFNCHEMALILAAVHGTTKLTNRDTEENITGLISRNKVNFPIGPEGNNLTIQAN